MHRNNRNPNNVQKQFTRVMQKRNCQNHEEFKQLSFEIQFIYQQKQFQFYRNLITYCFQINNQFKQVISPKQVISLNKQLLKGLNFTFLQKVKGNIQKQNLTCTYQPEYMGIDSSIQQRRQKFVQMFVNNYELGEERQDQVFGTIEVYRNKSTKISEIMVKRIMYHQQNQFKVLFDQMNQRILKPLPNLLGVYSVQIHKQKTFCASLFEVKIYVEYLEHNLKLELKKRRKNNSFFTEEKLWKILISLTNAIKHLHENGIFHGQIRVENVLIDGDYHMKLAQKLLLPKMNWQVQLQTENVKLIKGRGVLFSPVLLQCLYHRKTQLASYNPFKADIYAVGMIMLECSSLKKAQDFYDYDHFSIKTKQIFAALYQIRKIYSNQFCNLLSKMLEDQDNQRYSAQQVYSKIRKIPNNTIKQLNMTLNQSFLMDSVRSYM